MEIDSHSLLQVLLSDPVFALCYRAPPRTFLPLRPATHYVIVTLREQALLDDFRLALSRSPPEWVMIPGGGRKGRRGRPRLTESYREHRRVVGQRFVGNLFTLYTSDWADQLRSAVTEARLKGQSTVLLPSMKPECEPPRREGLKRAERMLRSRAAREESFKSVFGFSSSRALWAVLRGVHGRNGGAARLTPGIAAGMQRFIDKRGWALACGLPPLRQDFWQYQLIWDVALPHLRDLMWEERRVHFSLATMIPMRQAEQDLFFPCLRHCLEQGREARIQRILARLSAREADYASGISAPAPGSIAEREMQPERHHRDWLLRHPNETLEWVAIWQQCRDVVEFVTKMAQPEREVVPI